MYFNKFKVAATHFLISIIVVTLILGLIIFYWFPNPIIKVSNFKEIALIIILVDLVLGPLLTFVVFKPLKKGLKIDLALIALIQISALLFGVHNLYQVHPLYVTFNVDRFTTVPATEARPNKAIKEEFQISKFSSPKFVVSKLPEDIKERNELILNTMANGVSDFDLRSEYYHRIDDNKANILSKSLDPEIIFKKHDAKMKSLEFIKKHGKTLNDFAFLPLEGQKKTAVLVLDNKTAKPIDVIDVFPWTVEISNNTQD